jgi:hypothetical protein
MTKGYDNNKRWRLAHPDKRKEQRDRRRNKTSFAPNGRKNWTEEEERLALEFEGTDMELATKLGRSEHAIQVKRYRLNQSVEED